MMDESLLFIVDEAFRCINQNIPLVTLFQKKPKFEESITLALHLSTLDSSLREKIGVFWIDENTFALKTKSLANSIGLKPNSINCGLRQHQLGKVGKVPLEYIKDFNDKRNWKMMQDKRNLFTRTKVEEGENHDLLQWVKPEKKIGQIEKQKNRGIKIDMLSFETENNLSLLLNNDDIYDFDVDCDFDEEIEAMFDLS